MQRDASGVWSTSRHIDPGLYQYKFLVDGSEYVLDPLNPESIENYDGSGRNSSFVVTEEGKIVLTSHFKPGINPTDEYELEAGRGPIYLNIIWHQHQPLYVDPESDQLKGPWVRTHATKDYYDMAAMLLDYPEIHCTINLTSSLLLQIQKYYVDRLSPFVDVQANTIDVDRFLSTWGGKTDPWIDLALRETETFDSTDRAHIYGNTWNAFGISDVMIGRFPEYLRLKQKFEDNRLRGIPHTSKEIREAKFWFFLAYFDPDFLRGPVRLPDETIVDLSDLVEETSDGKFLLKADVTEALCRRMVIEAFKIMSNIVRLHTSMLYDQATKRGQIDVITTPYYHPILPLIFDSDLAKICQPADKLPSRFAFPEDARAQIIKAVQLYKELFGRPPQGMWPGEGAVAQPVLSLFREEGILWTASDEKVLKRSRPGTDKNAMPFRFPAGSVEGVPGSLAIVFRDTELSDRIGFKYQTYEPEEAAEDFIRTILDRRPATGSKADVLLTVILDGENAWEWYRKDNDGKGFLNAFYRKLSKLDAMGAVITTTMTEYLQGNKTRGIPAHPMSKLTGMTWLHPGSWINANYDTWIGEPEENTAWEVLLLTRKDLEDSGIPRPDPRKGAPDKGTNEWFQYMAWEEMYAAEGSDWFWWYGSDQSAPAGDKPFDNAFRTHLRNVHEFMDRAGKPGPRRDFPPIIAAEQQTSGQGVMAQSRELQPLLFTCNASGETVDSSIFIVGNLEALGAWSPNRIRMFDDGTHGDTHREDRTWSIRVEVPSGTEVLYKYTNSGRQGEWSPGEEFPGQNRRFLVPSSGSGPIVISDVFGKRDS